LAIHSTLSKGKMECAAGVIFDDLHENLLESVQALHYPKRKRSAPQAKKMDDSHENLLESVKAIYYPKGERSAP